MQKRDLLAWGLIAGAATVVAGFVLFTVNPFAGRNRDDDGVARVSEQRERSVRTGSAYRDDEPLFADELRCNICKVEQLKSQEGNFVLFWTDGQRGRLNNPVDLYIDTRHLVNWDAREAKVEVIVHSNTIRRENFLRKLEIRRSDLHRGYGNRGLIRIQNAFSIDPANHLIHEEGEHTIHVTLKTESETYTGGTTFVIGTVVCSRYGRP